MNNVADKQDDIELEWLLKWLHKRLKHMRVEPVIKTSKVRGKQRKYQPRIT